MKTKGILFIALILSQGMSVARGNESILSSSIHWPIDGDKVTKKHYEFVDVAVDSLVWDFSKAIETGDSHEMQWINVGDSVLLKKELGAQLTFAVKGDSVKWTAYENPMLELRDSTNRGVDSKTIHQLSDTIPYSFKGIYCKNNFVASDGRLTVDVSDRGMLILPNDTIADAFMVTYSVDGMMSVSSNRRQNANDSIMESHRIKHIVVVDKWYSPEFKYELAENVIDSYYFNDELIKESRATFLCLPEEQEYSLRNPDKNLKRTQAKSRKTSNERDSDRKTLADRTVINYEEGYIGVAIDFENLASEEKTNDVSGILCDQLGRIWHEFTRQNIADGILQIPSENLPCGNYILSLKVGKETIIKKLIIQ